VTDFVSIWDLNKIPISRKSKSNPESDRENLKDHDWQEIPYTYNSYSPGPYSEGQDRYRKWTGQSLAHRFKCSGCKKYMEVCYDNNNHYYLSFKSSEYGGKLRPCKIEGCSKEFDKHNSDTVVQAVTPPPEAYEPPPLSKEEKDNIALLRFLDADIDAALDAACQEAMDNCQASLKNIPYEEILEKTQEKINHLKRIVMPSFEIKD